jgi:hypothetical protein
LEDLDSDVDINSAWETVERVYKLQPAGVLDYYELMKHKPWLMKDAQNY